MNEIFLQKTNSIAIVLLILCIIIFLSPMLLQKERLFRDDGAYQAFLRLNAVANYIQKGEIPLWNPNTFYGAKPFYSMYEGAIYNIVLYPFLLLADTNNSQKAFYTLIILPFTLALIIAGIGSFFFARFILKVDQISSFFLGLIYALNPSMVISIISLHNTFVFAYIPWVLLFLIKLLETQKLKFWIASIISLILLSVSTNLNYVLRVYFFSTLVVLLYFSFNMKKNLKTFFAVMLTGTAFIFSIGLLAFMWGGIVEGILWIKDTGKITFEFIADEKMNFGNLVSIFIPNFTGLLAGRQAWGEAMKSNTNYILLGGLFLSLSALIALYYFLTNNNIDKNKRTWTLISLITLIGTILTMLSDRTPFLKIMSILLPPFFKIPFPHYYHFLQHWSMATLACIGISVLINDEIKDKLKTKILIIFVFLLVLTMLITLFEKTDFNGKEFYSFQTIKYLGRLNWFLTEPLLYILAFFILTIISLFILKNKEYKALIIIGIFIETIFFSYIACYRGEISAVPPWESEANDSCFSSRFYGPDDQPYYKYMLTKRDQLDKNYRYTGTITYIDNFSWLLKNYSLFGYDTKPVIKSMYNLMTQFMEGYPYQMVPLEYSENFLKNMNVKYIVPKLFGKTVLNFENKEVDNTNYRTIKIIENQDKNAKEEKVFELDNPMPYFYTQNKIDYSTEEDQLKNLLVKDLSLKAFADEKDIISFLNDKKNKNEIEFHTLQNINKIISIDRNYANKVTLKIDVREPALLIRQECYHPGWHAKVDGIKTKVIKVNYIQQTIFLKEGVHSVEFYFLPDSVKYGFYIALTFLIIFLSTIIAIFIKKKGYLKN